jgi:hypothetical protein
MIEGRYLVNFKDPAGFACENDLLPALVTPHGKDKQGCDLYYVQWDNGMSCVNHRISMNIIKIPADYEAVESSEKHFKGSLSNDLPVSSTNIPKEIKKALTLKEKIFSLVVILVCLDMIHHLVALIEWVIG